ncbi:MAG: alpha/beta hydrolase, partial [Actinomycetota bacterium]|nr:alpha/beta hydrolase [Actinomycetota bacterium]
MTTLSAPDGTRLAYTSQGSGPPLLCLPGGPGRAGAYLEDLAGLADVRTLVVLDNRATGRSQVPADPASLRFDRLAGDVEALREHLGVEQAEVLGHSAGTLVAQAWAANHPERVRALVLVTPSGR